MPSRDQVQRGTITTPGQLQAAPDQLATLSQNTRTYAFIHNLPRKGPRGITLSSPKVGIQKVHSVSPPRLRVNMSGNFGNSKNFRIKTLYIRILGSRIQQLNSWAQVETGLASLVTERAKNVSPRAAWEFVLEDASQARQHKMAITRQQRQ